MITQRSRELNINITRATDFSKIAPQVRWRMYFMWIKNLLNETNKKIANFEVSIIVVKSANMHCWLLPH